MKTHIAHAQTRNDLEDTAEAAVYLLSGGFPVALPTETVYGLAAWALDTTSLTRIFQSKERPLFDPLIVHLPTLEWLDNLCAIPAADRRLVDKLVKQFWPGPLTIVLPRKPVVPDLAAAGLPTIAVRMSAHPIFAHIIEAFGQPLAAPSANRFGRISPTTARHVYDELNGRIPLIVDGGATRHGVESTIVTVRENRLWILRNGPITAEELGRYADVASASHGPRPTVPGQLKSHYAPATPFQLLPHGATPTAAGLGKVGLLSLCEQTEGGFYHVEVLSEMGDLREAAANLFAKMRILDSMNLDLILAESLPEMGLGAAIMDRLQKAAGNG